MLVALEVSKNALPHCLPNPPVGCVIVRQGCVIATGFTQKLGSNHAEIDALSKISGTLEDCEMYVTLEPCSFVGRTPSCAMEIIRRKLGAVYVAIGDPDIRNNGKGLEILKKANISVNVGMCAKEVDSFLKNYLCLS